MRIISQLEHEKLIVAQYQKYECFSFDFQWRLEIWSNITKNLQIYIYYKIIYDLWIKSLIFIMVWFESQNRYFQKIIWYQTKLFWILEQHYFAYPCKHGRAVFKNVKFQTCAFLQEDGNTFLWKNINFQKMRLRKMNEWLSENQINTIYFCTEAQY